MTHRSQIDLFRAQLAKRIQTEAIILVVLVFATCAVTAVELCTGTFRADTIAIPVLLVLLQFSRMEQSISMDRMLDNVCWQLNTLMAAGIAPSKKSSHDA